MMLSIIIPTFNEQKYLPRLLESIERQTFKNYEIIIADNFSTDNTIGTALLYGCKVTSGGFPGAGRNQGAKIASGNIFLFLDADVVLEDKNFLSDCIVEFNKRGLDAATCHIKPISNLYFDKFAHQAYNATMLAAERVSPCAPGFCIFVKKSIHFQVNGFDEDIKLAEDTDYIQRVSKVGLFRVLNNNISVSVRRLDKDGRLTVVAKYILAGLHMAILGKIKSNIFNYKFGRYD